MCIPPPPPTGAQPTPTLDLSNYVTVAAAFAELVNAQRHAEVQQLVDHIQPHVLVEVVLANLQWLPGRGEFDAIMNAHQQQQQVQPQQQVYGAPTIGGPPQDPRQLVTATGGPSGGGLPQDPRLARMGGPPGVQDPRAAALAGALGTQGAGVQDPRMAAKVQAAQPVEHVWVCVGVWVCVCVIVSGFWYSHIPTPHHTFLHPTTHFCTPPPRPPHQRQQPQLAPPPSWSPWPLLPCQHLSQRC